MKTKSSVPPPPNGTAGHSRVSKALIPYLILAAIFILFSYVRIRLASFPLERDEGEYAYFGQLILHGIPPYALAYNLKLPGTYAAYALIMALFGRTMQGIRIGLLLVNLGSLVFIFRIMKRLFSAFSGLAAVAVAAVLFIRPELQGLAAHATHFVTFFALAGAWLLLSAIKGRKTALALMSGVMMGLAFIMKQSGIFFPIFGGVMILACARLQADDRRTTMRMQLIPYALGAVLPFLLTVLILLLSGVFDRFWFWTFIYPKVYGSVVPLPDAWGILAVQFSAILHTFRAGWTMAALGVAALFLFRGKRPERLFLGLWLVFSFLNAVPGFHFRGHYFIPMASAAGMLAGFFLEFINAALLKKFPRIAYATACALILLILPVLNDERNFIFFANPTALCHLYYKDNMFAEAIPVAGYIKANTNEEDRILVFGSEPEIYFYADRKSATAYIYMYDLAFAHPYKEAMQREMMREVEAARPRCIVVVGSPLSWSRSPGELDALVAWLAAYLKRNTYQTVALVNYHYLEPSEFYWGKDAMTHAPKNDNYMYILIRQE